MDRLDRALLEAVQEAFPVSPYPYEVIAARCDTSAEEAGRRIAGMRAGGVIRRLGAVLDSRALSLATTLVAADVRAEAVDDVASDVDGFPEVTHSYLREGRPPSFAEASEGTARRSLGEGGPNLWFTLVAASQGRIDEIVKEVRSLPGVLSAEEYPATRVFKLGVRVNVEAPEKPEDKRLISPRSYHVAGKKGKGQLPRIRIGGIVRL